MELIPAKTIITKNRDTSWFGSDYNMNLYRGCSHGCIYCDSRSSCYRVDDFEQIKAKENALQIVRDDLRRKVKKGVVGTGAMSDPYNPFEKELELTRHALELVDAFNADDTPAFLVSLKAGGTGLNLTGASVVVHADPWWNAAAQNQATDRAHRIGQTKVVSVHQVIAEGTIEERILRLQDAKSELADRLVAGGGVSLASLSKEELADLLQG